MVADRTHLSLLPQVPWPRKDRQWLRPNIKNTMLGHETFAANVDSRSWFIKAIAVLRVPPPNNALIRTILAPGLGCVFVEPIAKLFVVIPRCLDPGTCASFQWADPRTHAYRLEHMGLYLSFPQPVPSDDFRNGGTNIRFFEDCQKPITGSDHLVHLTRSRSNLFAHAV